MRASPGGAASSAGRVGRDDGDVCTCPASASANPGWRNGDDDVSNRRLWMLSKTADRRITSRSDGRYQAEPPTTAAMTISRTAVSAAVAALACTTAWLGRGTLRRVLGEGLASVPWLRPESLKTLFPGLSPWMCLVLPSVLLVAYFGYVLCFSPMDRVRLLGELGYVPDGKVDMQKMSKLVQRRRQTGDVPPVYPNGWFGILESRGLKAGNVRSVCVLGTCSVRCLFLLLHRRCLFHLRV